MQKHDERTHARTRVRKAFYNLPTTDFSRRREIIKIGIKLFESMYTVYTIWD